MANTAAFVSGKEANNVLLTGSRGTGKSTAVKALVSRYHEQGLRLVQLQRDQLHDQPRWKSWALSAASVSSCFSMTCLLMKMKRLIST